LVSPNFICPTKSVWRTEFGEKIAVQFLQHSASKCADKICQINAPFAQSVCHTPTPVAKKSFSSRFHKKVG